MTARTCQYCGRTINVFPSRIKDGRGKYCSKKCYQRGGKVKRICQICGREFMAYPSLVKSGGGKYCSATCYGKQKSIDRKGVKHTEESKKKMSLMRKGKPRYDMKGKGNHNWKGGITPVHFMLRGSPQYAEWRMRIYLRDDFTCQECGQRGGALEAHHKKPFAKLIREAIKYMPLFDPYTACMIYSPMWDVANGVTLCQDCHKKK